MVTKSTKLIKVCIVPSLRIMLRCCKDFVFEHGLHFNPSKTQLICFSWTLSSSCTARFNFCGQQLSFINTVSHLGHLLHYNLSDVPDINHKLRDMVVKANCSSCWSLSFDLSISILLPFPLWLGSALWTLSCPALYHLEVAFNKILHTFPIVVTLVLFI